MARLFNPFNVAVVDFGPAWHCYSGQRAAYASRPTLRDRRDDEQRGSPYDAKCNVAEIGAVKMGDRPSSRIRFLPVQAPETWMHRAVFAPILLLKLLITRQVTRATHHV